MDPYSRHSYGQVKPGLQKDQYAAVFHNIIVYHLLPQLEELIDEKSCITEKNGGKLWFNWPSS